MKMIKDILSSRQKGHKDAQRLALAIEGGGMAGAFSGGMCVFLEEAGLLQHFDVVYGCSSGALNGSYSSLGQAREGSKNYLDMSEIFWQPRRILRGKNPLGTTHLFESIIPRQRPLRWKVDAHPPFRSIAFSPRAQETRVLGDFSGAEEMLRAVQASCTTPLLGGYGIDFRGEKLLDGGIWHSLGFHSALEEGATHVLVLRSRSADYRKPAYRKRELLALSLWDRKLANIIAGRPERYNEEARFLEFSSTCQQITIQGNIPAPANPSRGEISLWLREGFRAAEKFFAAP